MLRPATPLAILLFIAFVLLLLSVISTPIVKGIPLASFQGVQFGVFGYCKGTQCTGVQVGYTTNSQTLFGNSKDDADFSLPPAARSSLSSILIVHPVAALLTLICFILAATAHLHSPSHSPRYLLALLILLLPTLLLSLLAFLVDILLFVPHLQWGGWIVLASTILIAASGVVTCAMRRTLVNRKARKKRIAENTEMSGANYFNRQEDTGRAESPPPLGSQPNAPPMMNGAPGSERLPTFATFESKRAIDEERVPLNQRSLSNKTLPSNTSATLTGSENEFDRHGGSGRGGRGGMRGGHGGRYEMPRDEYGNPLPPSNAFGPLPPSGSRRSSTDRGMNQYPNDSMNSQGFRGRGRGGYPPRGYGRGGPYGSGRGGPGMNGNGRGAPIGAMAAGAGAGYIAGEMGGRGQRGPPPGYGNEGPAGYGRSPSAPGYGRRPSPGPPSAPGGYGRQASPGPPWAPGGYGRRPSPGPPSAPGGYNRQGSPGPPSAPGAYSRQQSPGPPSAPLVAGYGGRQPSPGPPGQPLYRSESPPPPLPIQHPPGGVVIGQAVEMDAFSASPLQSPSYNRTMQLRDSDSDVGGLVALQQQRPEEQHDSTTNAYSSQEPYVPPRAAWAGGPARKNNSPPNFSQPRSPLATPVELPTEATPQIAQQSQSPPRQHTRFNSGDNYYEDVDPRFASPEPPQPPQQQATSPLPHSLMPGAHSHPNEPHYHSHLEPSSSFESIQEGARSPAASGDSDYTSISQRGINPAWRPPPQQGPGPNRGPPPLQQREMLLGSNPDFELPGMAARGGRMGGAGRGGRGAMPGPYPGGLI